MYEGTWNDWKTIIQIEFGQTMLCRGGDLTARDSIDLCAPEFYNERKLCIYMNRAKLEKLLTENMKAIFGFALMRTGNTEAAEELSSNIFI